MKFAWTGTSNKITFSKVDSLYKYFPIERISDFFNTGMVRFTIPFVFNDPFEIMPLYTKHNWQDEPFNQNFFGLNSENPLSYFGVLSLTDSPSNQLMWSHYTNSYRGFVIEFDKNHEFFKESLQPENFSMLAKVEYKNNSPILKEEDHQTLLILRDKYIKHEQLDFSNFPFNIFFVKNEIWQYENEWRLLRFRDNSNKVIKPTSSTISSSTTYEFENIHLFQIPFEAVKSIIFGAALSLNIDFNKFIFTTEYLKHIKIYETLISVDNYTLHFNEINL